MQGYEGGWYSDISLTKLFEKIWYDYDLGLPA